MDTSASWEELNGSWSSAALGAESGRENVPPRILALAGYVAGINSMRLVLTEQISGLWLMPDEAAHEKRTKTRCKA